MRNICIRDNEKAKLKRVTVNVTARDIIKGKRGECKCCPVALALNRLLKKPYAANVGISSVYYYTITDIGKVYGPDMPEFVSTFIYAFDGNKNPLPFKFRMSIPKMVLRKP